VELSDSFWKVNSPKYVLRRSSHLADAPTTSCLLVWRPCATRRGRAPTELRLSALPFARLAKDVPIGGCSGVECRLSWRRGWKVLCALIRVSSGPPCYMPRGVSLSPSPRGLRFGLDPATDQKVQAQNDGEGARYRKPRDYPEEHD
jgi:hypothetical protein